MIRKFPILLFGCLLCASLSLAKDEASLHHELRQIEASLSGIPEFIPSAQTHERIGFHGHAADPAWIQLDFGRKVTPGKIAIFPARLPEAPQPEENGFPSAFEILISDDPEFSSPVRIVSWKEEASGSALSLPFLIFAGNGASGQYLRLQVTGFRKDAFRPQDEYYRIGEIVVTENGQNVALHPPLTRFPTSTRSTENPRRWDWQNVNDGRFWFLPLRGKPGSPQNGFHSELVPQSKGEGESWVEVDLGEPLPIDEIHLVPSHPVDFPDAEGFGFPLQFTLVADPGTPSEQTLLSEVHDYPGEALPNPGAAQLVIATPGLMARTIRMDCSQLWGRGTTFKSDKKGAQQFLFALAEMQVWHAGQNLALGKAVRYSDKVATRSWDPEALVDGYSSREALLDWDTWLEQIARRHLLETRAGEILAQLQSLEEQSAMRWRAFSIAAVVLTALVAAIAILVMRARAVRAREELRAQIARDLHDEIGASLSHLAIQTHLVGQKLPEGSEDRCRLANISQSARETFDSMRDIVWMLQPAGGTWEELAHRMETIAKRLLQSLPNEVASEGEPPSGSPPMDWSRSVVAILKELANNALRHSQADSVKVRLDWGELEFELYLEDDGCGFDLQGQEGGRGSGLANLQHRAEELRGKLEVTSRPGEGTMAVLRVPMPKGSRLR